MNNKRQALEGKLPPPSQLLCSHLWNRLGEAGVSIPKDDIVLIARILSDYILNTKDGKITALKLLNASARRPEIRNAYHPFSDPNKSIDAKDLLYYHGWIYKETLGLKFEQIEVEKGGGLEACEATGILGPRNYCVQVVKTYGAGGRENLASLSNHARLYHDDPRVRDTASYDKCMRCPVESCEYHPNRNSRQLALVPQIKTVGG